MKPDIPCCLILLVITLMAHGTRKGKKDRKFAPQWKPTSMPALNKRHESVYEGKELILDCKAQGVPKPSITWLKDGSPLKNNNNIEVKKFSLVLKAVTTDMGGNYTCMVSNKLGQLNWTFYLDVQVKIWPLDIDGPSNITQTVGSNVTFRCLVLNDPYATIRWQRLYSSTKLDDSAPQSQAEFLEDGQDPHVLTLGNIEKEDEGEYRCMAGNVWGLRYSSAWLTVTDPVILPELPGLTDLDNRNNINNNDVIDDSFDDRLGQPEDMNQPEYDQGLLFATTKRPKNRGNKHKKNGRKKGKKDKDKTNLEEDLTSTSTITTLKTSTAASPEDIYKTTFPDSWQLENNKYKDEFSDIRYNPIKNTDKNELENDEITEVKYDEITKVAANHEKTEVENHKIAEVENHEKTALENHELKEVEKDDAVELGKAENTNAGKPESEQGSISSWTIYTIVGAAGGIILMIGLVAIILTLCYRKNESKYKTTEEAMC